MARTRDMDGKLIELAVVLVAHSNNPSILNPDFLIHNGIVSDGAEVEQPVISTPAFSQARFKGGVVITADPDRVIFTTNRGLRMSCVTEAHGCRSNERIESILDAWESDVDDVRCLIGKFCREK